MNIDAKKCSRCHIELTENNWKRSRWTYCFSCKAKMTKEYAKAHPEVSRKAQLKFKYGITPEEFEAMWEQQKGLCPICRKPLQRGNTGYHVDHVHGSDPVIIRGILCPACNRMLGLAHEDISTLKGAIDYLYKCLNMPK